MVLSVPRCSTPKTSSRWRSLRMTRWDNVHGKRSAPTSLCRSAPTLASLVYGVPRNERSRVSGVRVGGGGEPASRRESFKSKVTFLTISPPPANAGAPSSPGFPEVSNESFGGSRQREPRLSPTAIHTATRKGSPCRRLLPRGSCHGLSVTEGVPLLK